MRFALLIFSVVFLISCNSENANDTAGKTAISQSGEKKPSYDLQMTAKEKVEIIDEGSFSITGNIENGAGRPIFIQYYPLQTPGVSPSRQLTIDQTTIEQDGSFNLKGRVEKPSILVLGIDAQNVVYLVVGGGDIQINTSLAQFDQYDYSGPEGGDALREFTNVIKNNLNLINQYQTQIHNARHMNITKDQLYNIFVQNYKMHERQYNDVIEFIETTPSLMASLFAADLLETELHGDILTAYLYKVEEILPASRYIDHLNAKLKASEDTKRPAPELKLPTPDGSKMALSDLRGNVVLLDFWAAWCVPCRIENPNIVRIYERFKDEGFEVFSVSIDQNREHWLRAIEEDNLQWDGHVSELMGWNAPSNRLYNVQGIPLTFLIDREGQIIAQNLRGYALEKKLEQILLEN